MYNSEKSEMPEITETFYRKISGISDISELYIDPPKV